MSLLKYIRDEQQKPHQIWHNWDFQKQSGKHTMNPLYRAIFILMDTSQPPEYETTATCNKYLNLSKHSKMQNVLLVRTGLDSGLSAPIDFADLRNEHLPFNRPDIKTPLTEDWVVRVPLATAVKYISDLERREYAIFPELCVGAGPGNVSYWTAAVAEREINWSWEEESRKYGTLDPEIPTDLVKITEAVMNGTPDKPRLSYGAGRMGWGARYIDENGQVGQRG